tara:strand:- start:4004 stop:4981 length:978 start_codon:yes stop_codon:yes gene_type:complete
MASTYTDNIGLEKPGTGEQSGTWGDTTNTNFDIIDRAINGVLALSLTGTTTILTTTDGALSNGGYKVLVLGGSPSGTNTVTITPNDQDKLYLVKNASGQTATFTQGSGGNVSILNGETAWIFADGAGSGAEVQKASFIADIVQDTTPQLGGDLDVNGNSIVSTSNGHIALTPNGTGDVQLDTDTVRVGDNNANATITTYGTGDLTLSTNSGTNSGTISIADGADGNISLTPNGTGAVAVGTKLTVDNINVDGNTISTTDTNGNLTLSPNGTGDVVIDGELALGNWTIEVDGSNNLLFKYSGNTKVRMTSAGALDVEDDITAVAGI